MSMEYIHNIELINPDNSSTDGSIHDSDSIISNSMISDRMIDADKDDSHKKLCEKHDSHTHKKHKKTHIISPERFKNLDFDSKAHTQPYVQELQKTLGLEQRHDTIRLYSADEFDTLPEGVEIKDGYALCLGLNGLQKKRVYPCFVSGVRFKKQNYIDQRYIDKHHSFFKRDNEDLEATHKRLQNFFDEGGSIYVVENNEGTIVGSLNVRITGVSMAVFSFLIDPERRSKGVANLMIGNVITDAINQGVKYMFAKTKNKFIYYLLKKRLGGDLLWKEVYI